ncbi:MAG: hypothetical protein ACLFTR_04400, partial [Candidatus Woesearchaeota archaeon]
PCMSDNPDENLDIHVYGGSTTWGVKVEPNQTFPSRLSEFLCDEGINVNVTNYGQVAFMNSQEMVSFMFELKRGNIPDIVIFYDGVNEFFSNDPGMPLSRPSFTEIGNFPHMTDVFSYHMRDMMIFSSTIRFLKDMLLKIGLDNWIDFDDGIADIDYFNLHKRFTKENLTARPGLYEAIRDNYLSNVRLIKSLEDDYGFRAFFYWQPHLATKSNKSEAEKAVANRSFNKDFIERFNNSNNSVIDDIRGSDDVKDLTTLFDNTSETIYWSFAHKNAKGNEILAKAIKEDLMKHIE